MKQENISPFSKKKKKWFISTETLQAIYSVNEVFCYHFSSVISGIQEALEFNKLSQRT